MDDQVNQRRRFLKTAVAGGAVAAAGLPSPADAQTATAAAAAAKADAAPKGYTYLNPEEAAFVEALVDHMVPADDLTPKGTDLGLNIYIDRALAGSWGKGDRLYQSGPWKQGAPSQGYQLPLTPAELYRAGIAATNRHCVKTYGKGFDRITEAQREELLKAFNDGKVSFENGPPAGVFFGVVYQTVMEGMFADPIYGGNRDKAGWKMIGFPGVIATHRENIIKYKNKRYTVEPVGIADVS
jgi:gluconate 2-dehydrogenase gamma chain